jgi:UDP-2-acetamido-2-deoxy-ribo-hexuluronate aminotransferase
MIHMIHFIDWKAQYTVLEDQIHQRIGGVFSHGNYIMGPEIRELETELASFAGVKHAVSCSSGTDALLSSLMALDIGPIDAVFTTTFTFILTAEVIRLLGATPIFDDIDPVTFNIDPEKLEKAVDEIQLQNSRYPFPRAINRQKFIPKVIITVDLFGLPCDYDRIHEIATRHGLVVIENAAQAFGSTYKGKRAGALAHLGCTSFFPAKPLDCYGDGGAIFIDDNHLHEQLVSIRTHGKGTDKYDNVRIGLNGRMDTLQAAILLPKFAVFSGEIESRQNVARNYSLSLMAKAPNLIVPSVPEGWAQYPVLASDQDMRSSLLQGLKAAEIPTSIYYPKPLHLQTAFANLGYQNGDMYVSENSTTYPGTTHEELHPRIASKGLKKAEDFFLVYSPEREDPKNPSYSTHNIPKICGGETSDCLEVEMALYGEVIQTVVLLSLTQSVEIEVIRVTATKLFGFMHFYPGSGSLHPH